MKEEGQEYARVTKMLGNGRLEAACFDGVVRLAKIRGAIRKKVWIAVGDVVLVSLRDFQDNKCDVLGKLTPQEVNKLIRGGIIKERAHEDEPVADTSFAFEDVNPDDL